MEEFNTELTKAVFDKLPFQDLITYYKTDNIINNIYCIDYINDPIDEYIELQMSNDFYGMKEFSLKPVLYHIKNQKYTINIQYTENNKYQFKDIGIDFDALMTTKLIEISRNHLTIIFLNNVDNLASITYRKICKESYNIVDKILDSIYKIFNKEYKKVLIYNPKTNDLSIFVKLLVQRIFCESNRIARNSRMGIASYIICSLRTDILLRHHANYIIDETATVEDRSNNMIYKSGKLGNLTIYINPNQSNDDTSIILGRKNKEIEPCLVLTTLNNSVKIYNTQLNADENLYNIDFSFRFTNLGKNIENNFTKLIYKNNKFKN